MAKCSSDLDCLQDMDDRLSRIGQAVTEFEISHRFENSVSNINYLLIPILIILSLIFFACLVFLTRFKCSRNTTLELQPLTQEC